VGGRGGAGGALLVVLALLARRRRAWVALLVLAAAPAQATLVRRVGLEKMGQTAGLVVQGTVRSTEAVRRGDRIYTDVVIDVATCLKGACPARVTVRQLGGEVDGQGTSVEGAATFTVGVEVVLFLRARADAAFAPVGMAQGAFRVERDAQRRVRALVRDLGGLSFVGEPAAERTDPAELQTAISSSSVTQAGPAANR
jgi:hypothetical protein